MMNVRTLRSARVLSLAAGSGLLTLTMLMGGCVNQGEYDRLYETNRALTDRNGALERQIAEALSARNSAADQLARTEAALKALQDQNADLLNRLRQAGVDIAGLNDAIAKLGVGPLDPETDRIMQDLADQFPQYLEYDPRLGMLRFKSDVLFDSGSDAIRAEARPALSALAQVLNNPAAAPYEVIVLGHTDSQRISPGTARRFPTNVHLSAGRSISVRAALVDLGVNPGKMQVAGWGEFRPRVENTGSGNTPENRRVEFYLTRPRNTDAVIPAGGNVNDAQPAGNFEAQPDRSAPPTRGPDITK